MALWNPYKNYDKGMDDAYMGKEPQSNIDQYQQGYERYLQLEREEESPGKTTRAKFKYKLCSQKEGV